MASPSRPPRLGFLGLGWIGRHRLEAIVRAEAGEPIALCDGAAQAVTEALALAPAADSVSTVEELLARVPDGIVIATPSALHAEQSLAAIERGVPVFCQKPLGRNAAETRAVVEAARRRDLLLGVDLSYRHTAAGKAVFDLVRAGGIGDVYAANLVFHNAYGPDKPWFYDRKLSGGGCVIDLGVHLVDLALWCLGFPAVDRVSAQRLSAGRPLGEAATSVEDFAAAQLVLSNGAVVTLACSWKLPAGRDAVIEAAFYGTRGGVALRNVGGSFYDFVAERHDGTRTEALVGPPDAWGGRAAVAWARRLSRDRRFDAEAERLVDVSEVLDRIYAGR